ncbi:MAG: sigma-70 family RNA polymerase sigma factor [Candidatus Aminicenantes bacterium]|nr:MAG: sigma-70 family RNA polymerase sigma factor [Candidatus Aminicenantes bacterium]
MRGEALIDIESFYVRYGPMVLRRCRRMLKNEQSAHDAMHEVFLKILSNQNRLSGEYPSALLYRIATNVCLNRIRNEQKHTLSEYLDILYNTSFFENHEANISAQNLMAYILSKEKDSTRQIAILYFVNGMTIKEIAETMNLSISGVHKHLDKLRRKMRDKGEI